MIKCTDAYKAAITGDTRRIFLKAVIDIIDPDIVYGVVDSSGAAEFSKAEDVHDRVFQLSPYATLEHGRWLLNGTFQLIPEGGATKQIGFVGNVLSGDDGAFPSPVWAELQFSNVSILQACSVYFSDSAFDGVPSDFTVEVKQGGTAYYTKQFTGNTATSVSMSGFTVQNPDAIRVTVTKWSLPHRRIRISDILPGVYENWDGSIIAEFSLKHQGDVSCITLPYGTCTIKMDNLDRRFEPRSKGGIFQSIEDRQGIPVSMGVQLPDGSIDYKSVGVFYQYSGGWKTGDNGITMQWNLVDIVGLVKDREFIPPAELPTTLKGWIAAIVAQLGVNFENCYTVDPNYAEKTVSVQSRDDITGMTCGDILRYACMASGTWPRADAETGYLAAEPLWDQGDEITLRNLNSYPTIRANSDIAAIIFTLNDGKNTQYVVSGNSSASSETQSINNPFIKTQDEALTAARLILSTYGGNKIEITGRGDMASEIGDVDSIQLDGSSATTARRIQQDLSLTDGVLKNCASVLLQADGSFNFQDREVITQSGTWTAPEGVLSLRAIVVGKGKKGGTGTDGTWDAAGEQGEAGAGANVWAGTISINPRQAFEVNISGETTFGQYSSANGETYKYGYTDIASGDIFARSGVDAPLPGSGDGGAGGAGGVKGEKHTVTKTGVTINGNTGEIIATWPYEAEEITNYPGPGQEGVEGATGCVVVYYNKVG